MLTKISWWWWWVNVFWCPATNDIIFLFLRIQHCKSDTQHSSWIEFLLWKEEPWCPAVISPEYCLIGSATSVGRQDGPACVCDWMGELHEWKLFVPSCGKEMRSSYWMENSPSWPTLIYPPTKVGASLNESHQCALWAETCSRGNLNGDNTVQYQLPPTVRTVIYLASQTWGSRQKGSESCQLSVTVNYLIFTSYFH